MASDGLRIRIRIEGADEVIAALTRLPRTAQVELKREAFDIGDYLADKIKIAGRSDSRQSARAASSVKAKRGSLFPTITAGGTARSRPVIFGSEFGMTRRSGWYAKGRYHDSPARQFRPHLGAGSYWFFRTAEREQPWVAQQWHEAADRAIRNTFGRS